MGSHSPTSLEQLQLHARGGVFKPSQVVRGYTVNVAALLSEALPSKRQLGEARAHPTPFVSMI